jgi:hypothetical protein
MLYAIFSRASGLRQSRTQSMPVRRLGAGHAQHLTCEWAYSRYEFGGTFGGTTSYSEGAKYILKDAVL